MTKKMNKIFFFLQNPHKMQKTVKQLTESKTVKKTLQVWLFQELLVKLLGVTA